jgi:hypothetical protein
VSLGLPQISYGLARDRTRNAAVRRWQLRHKPHSDLNTNLLLKDTQKNNFLLYRGQNCVSATKTDQLMVYQELVSTVRIVRDAQLHFVGKTLIFQTWQHVRATATNELSRINAWWSNDTNRRPTWSFGIRIVNETELNYFTVWLHSNKPTTILPFKHAYKQTYTCEKSLVCSVGTVTTAIDRWPENRGWIRARGKLLFSFSQSPDRLSGPSSLHVHAMKARGEVKV